MDMFTGALKSLLFRIKDNPKTTFGGGTLGGIVVMSLVGKLEEMSGCSFTEAFAGLDYGQLLAFVVTQVFGALVTDSNKTTT